MSTTYQKQTKKLWNSCKIVFCCNINFLKFPVNKVYQTLTQRETQHLLLFIVFWNLWDKRSTFHKKERGMLGSKFLPLSLALFELFWQIWTCCALVLVLLNFEMWQHSTIPNKRQDTSHIQNIPIMIVYPWLGSPAATPLDKDSSFWCKQDKEQLQGYIEGLHLHYMGCFPI